MRKFFIVSVITFISIAQANAQGCVAIRSNGGTCTMDSRHSADTSHQWSFSVNSRYFRSYKHFIGTVEQKQRVAQGSEVINHVFSTELGLTHQFNARWSFGLYAPIIDNSRSSLYEHDGKNRYTTHSFGLGDVRFAFYYWLTDPAKMSKFNAQVGLGIKLPTGDYRYQDYFHKNDSVKILGPVDQSIQLGDGGTGITLEVNALYNFSDATGIYFNGFYLSNPREQNGVSTARGGTTSPTSVLYGSDVMSVPDQYMARMGLSYATSNFYFQAGGRMECVPAKDLIGGSAGFRRPGFVISAEPVVAYKTKKAQFYVSVPVAVVRDRTQSVPDKIKTQLTGVYSQGDAAFADYTINVGATFALK